MPEHDPNLDALIDASADQDQRAARDALAGSADGRRLLAVHDALIDPPAPPDVPNMVPAVMARIAAAAAQAPVDRRTATTMPRETWRMRLAAWFARAEGAFGPALAVGAIAGVAVLAVLIERGSILSGGLSGAAALRGAQLWPALAAAVLAAFAVLWWLRRR